MIGRGGHSIRGSGEGGIPDPILEAWKVASPETEIVVRSVYTSLSLRAQQVLTYKQGYWFFLSNNDLVMYKAIKHC